MKKEWKVLVADLRRQGYVVEHARSGHLKVYRAESKYKVTIPATPSDSHKGMLNALRDLRRIGYEP